MTISSVPAPRNSCNSAVPWAGGRGRTRGRDGRRSASTALPKADELPRRLEWRMPNFTFAQVCRRFPHRSDKGVRWIIDQLRRPAMAPAQRALEALEPARGDRLGRDGQPDRCASSIDSLKITQCQGRSNPLFGESLRCRAPLPLKAGPLTAVAPIPLIFASAFSLTRDVALFEDAPTGGGNAKRRNRNRTFDLVGGMRRTAAPRRGAD